MSLDSTNALRVFKNAMIGTRAAYISPIGSFSGIIEDAAIDGKRILVVVRDILTNQVRKVHADRLQFIDTKEITNG